MNETVLYNVWHIEAYGFLVLAYFFLGGMAGGSFLVSAFTRIYGKEEYKDITKIGAISSIILVAIAGLCLLVDLGQPQRVFFLLTKFHVHSPVSWGTLIIGLFSLCNLIYLYYLLVAKDDKKTRLWGKIGIVFAVLLTSYTGLLLSMGKARPLWHSAIMPPLFLVSGSIAGLALISLVANLLGRYSPDHEVMGTLRRALVILILIDIFFLSDMYVLYVGLSEAHEIALLLIAGKFAFLFWGVELLLGSVLPVIILYTKKLSRTTTWQIVASGLAIIGVFTMRYIILIIGQYLPIS